MHTQRTMLVVEDNDINREMLIQIFQQDFTILTAEDGREALQILHDHPVDIVLLDLYMTDVDGFSVLSAVRADDRLSNLPVVVITAAGQDAERRALALGADDYVTKPFDTFIIHKRVDNLVRKYLLQVDHLRQVLQQSAQVEQARADYLARVSHEVRVPVNSMVGLAQMMQGRENDPVQMKNLSAKLLSNGRYLQNILNNVLDMDAVDRDMIAIHRVQFNFRKMLEDVAALFYGQCQRKNLRFDLRLDSTMEEHLIGDPLRVRQILSNLVSNAVKFTPVGGHVSMRVRREARVEDMVQLRFEVADTGIGMTAEQLSGIWDPRVQSNNGRGNWGGSGLGLPLVRRISALMGGAVSVESEPEIGSLFAVELPFHVVPELPLPHIEDLSQVRALVVDTDEETRSYIHQVLDRLGIPCDLLGDTDQALPALSGAFEAGHGYDICFMDWQEQGAAPLRAIREKFDADTLILAVTAFDKDATQAEALAAGATLVVPKPLFQSTVFDMLMDMTGRNYAELPAHADRFQFAGRQILLAEDNTINAQVATELLRLGGFHVTTVSNGQLACLAWENSAPGFYDAIIMDIQMPVMNGLAAARRIRASAHAQAKTIPIIAVTADAMPQDVSAALAAGMSAHLSKPINTEALYRLLTDLLHTGAEDET